MASKVNELSFDECLRKLVKLSNDILNDANLDIVSMIDVFGGRNKELDPKNYEMFFIETEELEKNTELLKFWANDALDIQREEISEDELTGVITLCSTMTNSILNFNALYRESDLKKFFVSEMAKENSITGMKIAAILIRMKEIARERK